MVKLFSARQLTSSGRKMVGAKHNSAADRAYFVLKICLQCEKEFGLNKTFLKYKNRGKFCSRGCQSRWSRKNIPPSERVLASRKSLVDWCKRTGGWHQLPGRSMPEEAIQRMAATKRAAGDPFKNGGRGGNGRGMTPMETKISSVLLPGWKSNFTILTQKPLGHGFPACYKPDFAWPEKKIALEIDGESHNSKKAKQRDLKKQRLLEQLGWCVLRLTNKQVGKMFGISK